MSAPSPSVPGHVTLTVWGVPRRAVPGAVWRMGRERRPVRTAPGLRFAKLLGTGSGRTFTPGDADPRHWALLACWDDADAARAFADGRVHARWDAIAQERLDVAMSPLTSRGTWAGRTPFGDPDPGAARAWSGPVAAVTRARLAWRHQRRFWTAVPDVARDLHEGPGLRLSLGIGEAPVGLQGTFSVWRDAAALTDFAYRRIPHAQVVAASATTPWFVEELFARLAVLDVRGTLDGRSVDVVASGPQEGRA
ncbi:MAG: monooxygenase [Kineosporiaceae bacterium]